jgi:hypothetical protein
LQIIIDHKFFHQNVERERGKEEKKEGKEVRQGGRKGRRKDESLGHFH